MNDQNNKYDDIIHLPHHVSTKHPQMPRAKRAAQFSPFAALIGYGSAVQETARLTDRKIELDEYEKAALDHQLQFIQNHKEQEVQITYFVPDLKKEGGEYRTAAGTVKKMDVYGRMVCMADGTEISIEDILQIDTGTLQNWD